MRFSFIETHRFEFSVHAMCRMLMVHFSGFYAWLKEPLSQRAVEDVRQTEMIQQAWADSGKVYEYRKLHDDLLDQGETCSENLVARLASNKRASQRRLATNVVLASMVANQRSSLTTHWTGSSRWMHQTGSG